MRGCPKCKELSEELGMLIVTYWDSVDNNKLIAVGHSAKPNAENLEHTTKAAMLEARRVLEDHMTDAHPHLAAN